MIKASVVKNIAPLLKPQEEVVAYASGAIRGRLAGFILRSSGGFVGVMIGKLLDRGKSGPATAWFVLTTERVLVLEGVINLGLGMGGLIFEAPRQEMSSSLRPGFYLGLDLNRSGIETPVYSLLLGFALRKSGRELAAALASTENAGQPGA
jgi:hypothetical protein